MKRPGFTNGYIQFTFTGGAEHKGRLMSATKDENTVFFTSRQYQSFVAVKERIESIRDAESNPASNGQRSTGLDDLERLADLKERGFITDADYEAKKRQILGI